MVISQCFPIMHNKSHSFAFGYECAKVDTALLNRQATRASALPTERTPLAFIGDPDREVAREGYMIQEKALVYINREGFTDKAYSLWRNHFGVWLDA